MRLERGTVVPLALDPAVGHEQRGVPPCIVVGDPDVIADQRFPLVAVVPVAGTDGEGALYPMLQPGARPPPPRTERRLAVARRGRGRARP